MERGREDMKIGEKLNSGTKLFVPIILILLSSEGNSLPWQLTSLTEALWTQLLFRAAMRMQV
jgi:hypothetical protein